MDWLDLLAVQGTLESLLQHHSSEASILWRSAFFTVQLLHPYMTTGKITALNRRTFVGKVLSLLFNKQRLFICLFIYVCAGSSSLPGLSLVALAGLLIEVASLVGEPEL